MCAAMGETTITQTHLEVDLTWGRVEYEHTSYPHGNVYTRLNG